MDEKTSELDKPAPSAEEVEALLNPDFMSGSQIKALKAMDEKNVDREDLAQLLAFFMSSYQSAKK